ncbi:hypothetical protein [Paracidovorax citrulli]
MTKAASPVAKALLSDYPVGVADPDYDHRTGPTGNPYDVKARTEARDTAFFDQPILADNRPGGPHALQLAPPPGAEGLQRLLLEGKRESILEEVGKDPKGNTLAAVTFARDNGQPVLLAALLRLGPVRDQLSLRLQTIVPQAIKLLLDDRNLSEAEAGDALRQLLEVHPGFRSSAEGALCKRWEAAQAHLDPQAVTRLAETARQAGLSRALPPLDPLAALRSETASIEQIIRWIDQIDAPGTWALREAVPADWRVSMVQPPPAGSAPPAVQTVLSLLQSGQHRDAKALCKLLHAAGVPLPAMRLLHAIEQAYQAGSLHVLDVVPLLSAALHVNLSANANAPLPAVDGALSAGETVLHLAVKERALDLLPALFIAGATVDADILGECTARREVRTLLCMYKDKSFLRKCKEALQATPQAWADIVDTLLHPLDDPDDGLLRERADMLTRLLTDPPNDLKQCLAGTPRDGLMLRFACRVRARDRSSGYALLALMNSRLDLARRGTAGAMALDSALRDRAWAEAGFLGKFQTNFRSARELAAMALRGGAGEADLGTMLRDARRKHRQRNPLARLFLFLRYGWDAWSKQPVKVADRHSTIVELLKERSMDLPSVLNSRRSRVQ